MVIQAKIFYQVRLSFHSFIPSQSQILSILRKKCLYCFFHVYFFLKGVMDQRYGTADHIQDILDQRGLIWTLDSLAHASNQLPNRAETANTETMERASERANGQSRCNDDVESIVKANESDKTYYMINSPPATFCGYLLCDEEVKSTNISFLLPRNCW